MGPRPGETVTTYRERQAREWRDLAAQIDGIGRMWRPLSWWCRWMARRCDGVNRETGPASGRG